MALWHFCESSLLWWTESCLSSAAVRPTTALREEAADPVFPASGVWTDLVPPENPAFMKDPQRISPIPILPNIRRWRG